MFVLSYSLFESCHLCAVIVPFLCRHHTIHVPSLCCHRTITEPSLCQHCPFIVTSMPQHWTIMLFILSLNCSLFLSLDLDHIEAQLADRGLDTEQVQQELDTISFTFKEKIHQLQTQLAGAERQNLDLQESLRYAGTMLETMKEESKMKDGEIVKLREEFMTELKDERRYLDQFHKAIKFIARKIVCVAIVILYCKKDKTDKRNNDGTLHFFFFALPSNLLSTVTALSLIPSSSLNPTTSTTWPSP